MGGNSSKYCCANQCEDLDVLTIGRWGSIEDLWALTKRLWYGLFLNLFASHSSGGHETDVTLCGLSDCSAATPTAAGGGGGLNWQHL